MATLTKKELLEAIKDMPDDMKVYLETDLWIYENLRSAKFNEEEKVIILSIYH